jgi:pyruvate dehydrogenase E1 component alpha subunit
MEKKKKVKLNAEDLRSFESEVIKEYEGTNIRGPVHLSYGNEEPLIDIFQYIDDSDWIFSTWRNHYHALLHGIDKNWLMNEVLSGRSINISNGERKFHTSAIVGGIIPIATGTAMGIKRKGANERVWCFIGDMAYSLGAFYESYRYAKLNNLPITFIVEDNGKSTNSPTLKCWNPNHAEDDLYVHPEVKDNEVFKIDEKHLWYYKYTRKYQHVGIGKWIYF